MSARLSAEQPGSITAWIARLKQGDAEAATRLWRRYATRVLRLAKKKLGPSIGGVSDEEDVAAVVLDALLRGVVGGRFPELTDRRDLWALLIRLTERKAVDARRHAGRRKRGGGRAARLSLDSGASWRVGPHIVDPNPTPEVAATLADQIQTMLARLDDDVQRAIAVLRLQGYEIAEIAERLGRARRTVERKLALVRRIWSHAFGEGSKPGDSDRAGASGMP